MKVEKKIVTNRRHMNAGDVQNIRSPKEKTSSEDSPRLVRFFIRIPMENILRT